MKVTVGPGWVMFHGVRRPTSDQVVAAIRALEGTSKHRSVWGEFWLMVEWTAGLRRSRRVLWLKPVCWRCGKGLPR